MKKMFFVLGCFFIIVGVHSNLYAVTLDDSGTGGLPENPPPPTICHEGALTDYDFEPLINRYRFEGKCKHEGEYTWNYILEGNWFTDKKEAVEGVRIETHTGDIYRCWVKVSCPNDPWLYSCQCTVIDKKPCGTFTAQGGPSYPYSSHFLSDAEKSDMLSVYNHISTTHVEAPTNLRITGVHPTGFTLEWNDNSNNEEGFAIERSYGLANLEEIAQTTKDSYTDSNCLPCRTYNYRVRAFYRSAASDYTGLVVYKLLKAPENLNVEIISQQIVLTWSDPQCGEMNFQIEMKSGNGDYTNVTSVDGDETSYVHDFSYSANTTYTYRIKAYLHNFSSPWSSDASITTSTGSTGNQPPAAPSNLVALHNNDQINLTWTDNSNNESGFRIEHKTTDLWEQSGEVGANVNQFSMPFAPKLSDATFRVYAYNPYGNSSYSNEAPLSGSYSSAQGLKPKGKTGSNSGKLTPGTGFTKPAGLKYKAIGQNSIMLYWKNKNDGITGFTIERKERGGIFSVIGNVDGQTSKFKDVNLKPDTIYYYRLCAHKGTTKSGYSKEVNVSLKKKKNIETDQKMIKQ